MRTILKVTLVAAVAYLLTFSFNSVNAVSQSEAVTSVPIQPAMPTISDDDRAFMMEAASGGMAEVEMGRLAAKKGRSAAVKAFGQRMVRDHSQANAELKRLARRKGVTLPPGPTDEQKAEREKLSNLSGADFDREYMSMMVEDHNKDVKAFQDKAGNAGDADLKRFVVKTLPTLKMHQTMANRIKARQ
jgi:putative membrane protein